jgi:hypothetical protein
VRGSTASIFRCPTPSPSFFFFFVFFFCCCVFLVASSPAFFLQVKQGDVFFVRVFVLSGGNMNERKLAVYREF